jgi:6-phosphofructokinase 1
MCTNIIVTPTIAYRLNRQISPLVNSDNFGGGFIDHNDLINLNLNSKQTPLWAPRAGARYDVYHDPSKTCAAIVTAGGLSPGLNNIIQNVTNKLVDYGVNNILGIRNGFKGFLDGDIKPIHLDKNVVEGIQFRGGTILGTSRGGFDIKNIVKKIDLWGIDMLFVVGGNGSHAGAELIRQNLDDINCCVIGIPKTIDNDIHIIDKTFGFDTAVEEAQRALVAAKTEASSAYKGIGIVKLMGRQSGFVALNASLASGVVDVCLIPEVPFCEKKLCDYVDTVIKKNGHAVVCVAEGCGHTSGEFDVSGNPVLEDVGKHLKSLFKDTFPFADIKLLDPSYMIRSVPANTSDRIYCKLLGHNAVHAAFAGFTGITSGMVNSHYCYLPIYEVIKSPRRVNPNGRSWNRLRSSNNQPNLE